MFWGPLVGDLNTCESALVGRNMVSLHYPSSGTTYYVLPVLGARDVRVVGVGTQRLWDVCAVRGFLCDEVAAWDVFRGAHWAVRPRLEDYRSPAIKEAM